MASLPTIIKAGARSSLRLSFVVPVIKLETALELRFPPETSSERLVALARTHPGGPQPCEYEASVLYGAWTEPVPIIGGFDHMETGQSGLLFQRPGSKPYFMVSTALLALPVPPEEIRRRRIAIFADLWRHYLIACEARPDWMPARSVYYFSTTGLLELPVAIAA